MDEILSRLMELRDEQFADFNSKLLPGIDRKKLIGVRTPALRKMATWIWKNGLAKQFLRTLPHEYFELNNLHAFLLEKIKDYDVCLKKVNVFLPYVDNWATCDQLRPKAFAYRPQLIEEINNWLSSDKIYTVRFAIGMLMTHFLDGSFRPEYLVEVASVSSDNYYINMMIAWYFATALSKHFEDVFPFLEQKRLNKWVHNKTIQKAIESKRIPQAVKDRLRSLKR